MKWTTRASGVGFPTQSLHDAHGQVRAVSPEHPAPAYEHLPCMKYDDMRAEAKAIGGYIMQQDDPWLPPFALHNYRNPE